MLKKNFVVSEKTLERWGFYGWDVENLKVVTEKDAEEYKKQDNKVILKFKNYIATPLVIHVNEDNNIIKIIPGGYKIVVIIKNKEIQDVITSDIHNHVVEKFGKIDGNILYALISGDARIISNPKLGEILDASIYISNDELYLETKTVLRFGEIVALNYYIDNILYDDFLDELRKRYYVVLDEEDFVLFTTRRYDDVGTFIVPTKGFLKQHFSYGRYLVDYTDMENNDVDYSWNYVYLIEYFYNKFNLDTKYLAVDRNPDSIMMHGLTKNGKVVSPWDGTRVYDYEGIEIYKLKDRVKIANTIRVNNRGTRIVSIDIENPDYATVIYKMSPTLCHSVIALIATDGKVLIQNKNVPIIKDIADNIKAFLTENVTYVNYRTFGIIATKEVKDLWTITAELVVPIGKTGYGVKETKQIDLKEHIKNFVIDVLYEKDDIMVVLRRDDIVQAIVSPKYVENVIGHVPDFEMLEYEVEITLEKRLSNIVRDAVRGAKRKLRNVMMSKIIVDEAIEYFRTIPDVKFTFRDSIAAGNCEYGTKLFIEEEKLQDKKYLTLQEMLKFMKKDKWYNDIARIIKYKYLLEKEVKLWRNAKLGKK